MPRILVIDDDQNVRDILERTLTRVGYEILTAADGNQGIRLFREQGADLVITDILMPEKEGFETILELRQEFPEVKIIVVSGGGNLGHPSGLLSMAKEFGAAHSFQKPIPREELLATIVELIGPGR